MSVTLATLERRAAALTERLAPPKPAETTSALMARLGFQPDPWQAAVLEGAARQVLLNCCRQSGKSMVAAFLGLRTALYEPGSLILVLSPGERQSKLLFHRIVDFYRRAGQPVGADVENKLSLELANGSEIHALPGSEATVRGFSAVSLLLIDEASRVDDDLYASIRPMLAVSGGRLVAMSTPWGKRGWWFHEWAEGGDGWLRIEVPATACPRIPADFLEEERRAMGPLWFASEYECRFVDTVDQVFRHEDVMGMISDEVTPLEVPPFVPTLRPAGGGDQRAGSREGDPFAI